MEDFVERRKFARRFQKDLPQVLALMLALTLTLTTALWPQPSGHSPDSSPSPSRDG